MQEAVKFKSMHWLNIKDASEAEILALKTKYHFHELDLEDCLSDVQRPKIDEYDKYLFIVLNFPGSVRRGDRLESEQLNIFIGQNYLVTVSKTSFAPLNKVYEQCKNSLKERRYYFEKGTGYLLYELLYELFQAMFPITDRTQLALKKIETELFESKRVRDQLLEIMTIKKNIITLRKIIFPQRTVIAALEHKQKRFLPEDLEVYFDDVVDKIEKLWNILETQKEVIQSLEDTNESLLSHHINNTMRTLTVFSVIMLPLTFITGLFGMNVGLPFESAMDQIDHFWRIISSMGILVALMVVVFKWKKWL